MHCMDESKKPLNKATKSSFNAYGPYYLDIPYEIGSFGTGWIGDYTKFKDVDDFYKHLKSQELPMCTYGIMAH